VEVGLPTGAGVDFVGDAVGVDVGTGVDFVGDADGDALGVDVGTGVDFVGDADGDALGVDVGTGVDFVGDADGEALGDSVLEAVGVDVGAGVDAVGADVEGSSHAPTGTITRDEPDGLSHSSTQVAPPVFSKNSTTTDTRPVKVPVAQYVLSP